MTDAQWPLTNAFPLKYIVEEMLKCKPIAFYTLLRSHQFIMQLKSLSVHVTEKSNAFVCQLRRRQIWHFHSIFSTHIEHELNYINSPLLLLFIDTASDTRHESQYLIRTQVEIICRQRSNQFPLNRRAQALVGLSHRLSKYTARSHPCVACSIKSPMDSI